MSRGPFRAPAWAWILTAAAVAAFMALGQWQLNKGRTKQAMMETLAQREAPAEIVSSAYVPPQGLELRRAQATGTYLPERQLLMDGQSHQHLPGYRVWTPLLLADGAALLVDRGWIPQDRSVLDGGLPAGKVTVTGFWRALPEPGVRLGGTVNCPAEKSFPAMVLYPTYDDVECLLARPVIAGLLLLDPEVAGGFVREWTYFSFPPQRHYAYAFQWLVLALAAIVVFVAVNRKRA